MLPRLGSPFTGSRGGWWEGYLVHYYNQLSTSSRTPTCWWKCFWMTSDWSIEHVEFTELFHVVSLFLWPYRLSKTEITNSLPISQMRDQGPGAHDLVDLTAQSVVKPGQGPVLLTSQEMLFLSYPVPFWGKFKLTQNLRSFSSHNHRA